MRGADLDALIARVEAASRPDRGLDLDLARTLVPDVIVRLRRGDDNVAHTYWRYTEKIDDALALCDQVLPGHELRIGNDLENRRWWAAVDKEVWDESFGGEAHAEGSTPGLALVLALLRALTAGAA